MWGEEGGSRGRGRYMGRVILGGCSCGKGTRYRKVLSLQAAHS